MTAPKSERRHSIFAIPILLGIVSLVGLVVGLLGDGVIDLAGWVALGLPVLAIIWSLTARRA